MTLTVGVTVEMYPGEQRVALVPAGVSALVKAGLQVLVEQRAGERAGFSDAEYEAQGARLAERPRLFASADVLLYVRGLGANPKTGHTDLELLRPGQVVLGLLGPLNAPQAMQALAERGVTALALELLPRISRAQPMDALTAMATVSGYKAVLLAAGALPKMFPLMMTAAGTITPARVFVVGAGVAGLQAIATARRLGAVVQAYDVRPAVKEQVESLGARFVDLPLQTAAAEEVGGYTHAMDESFYRRQAELMERIVAEHDVVITTALVPGHRAPVLVTTAMVKTMRLGSVVVDLAAEQGGNCEATQSGKTVLVDGITVIGAVNLPATIPYDASQMYSRNISAFLLHLVKDGRLSLDMADEITRETLVTHNEEVVHPRVRETLGR